MFIETPVITEVSSVGAASAPDRCRSLKKQQLEPLYFRAHLSFTRHTSYTLFLLFQARLLLLRHRHQFEA